MLLKRKRSDSEISTSSSLLSSPGYSSHMNVDFQSLQIPTPTLFASRTRKRHRDNRPSEAEVHQHTLSLLYSAQHQNPQRQAPVFQAPEITESIPPVSNQHDQRQSSLHAFWTLPRTQRSSNEPSSAVSSVSVAPAPISQFSNTSCEDCDACLTTPTGDDSMDVDMDVDVYGMGVDFGCSACGKQVCHQCAVSNLGSERMCLVCAGRKRWVGGLGWVTN